MWESGNSRRAERCGGGRTEERRDGKEKARRREHGMEQAKEGSGRRKGLVRGPRTVQEGMRRVAPAQSPRSNVWLISTDLPPRENGRYRGPTSHALLRNQWLQTL